jgi:hypothetical protein
MRLRIATLLIPGILFSSVPASEASRPLTVQEVVKQMDERGRARSASLAYYTCLRRYMLSNPCFHQTAELRVRERMDQPDVYSVAFSPDGRRLVTAGGDFFSSWS